MEQNTKPPTKDVKRWLEERTNINFQDAPNGRRGALVSDLHRDYREWCNLVKCESLDNINFGWALTRLGIEKHKMGVGNGRRLLLNSNKYPEYERKTHKHSPSVKG